MADETNSAVAFLSRFAENLGSKVDEVESVGIKQAEALLKERVFTNGIATDGNPIGQYSSKAGYYGIKAFDVTGAFKPTGKSAKILKSGVGLKQGTVGNKPRKTMYLGGGYRQLRAIQGKRTDTVNLQYKNDLKDSIQTAKSADGTEMAVYGDKQVEKKQGAEKHFSKVIFSMGDAEIEKVVDAMNEHVDRIVDQLL